MNVRKMSSRERGDWVGKKEQGRVNHGMSSPVSVGRTFWTSSMKRSNSWAVRASADLLRAKSSSISVRFFSSRTKSWNSTKSSRPL